MEQLLEYDKDLFLFLNNLGSESWDTMWLIITEKLSSIPLYALLLYLIFRHYGWKVAVITMVVVAAMITCTDQLANLFKNGFQRLRPCHLETLGEYARVIAVRCGRYGYFSAHAASSMALAVFIGRLLKPHYKYIIPLLLLWALVIGYSRIYLGVHYPLDVLTGFVIGAILGCLFYRLLKYILSITN